MAICAEQAPPAFSAGDGHTGACWLLDPGGDHSADDHRGKEDSHKPPAELTKDPG